jgi:uncharacterized repeat protein (TIGR03803 family)
MSTGDGGIATVELIRTQIASRRRGAMKFTAFVLAAALLGLHGSTMFAQTLTTLATFSGPNGSDPQGGLVMDASGNLYGTTFNGGQFGAGTIFEVDAATHSLTTLFSFNGANGGEPDASLTFGADGNLYGTSRIGGTFSSGTAFSLNPSTRSLTTLASFDGGANGRFPLGPVVLDTSGNIYGTTSSGGAVVWGTVFEITGTAHTLNTLFAFSFGGPDGQSPHGGMTFGPDGNLYGTTANTLFRLSTTTHVLTTLASFNSNTGGPPSDLYFAPNGDIYGTTEFGGFQNNGTIFRFSISTQTVTTIATFDGDNGSEPRAGFIADGSGILYGTTLRGGVGDGGTVFRFDPATNEITTLAQFGGGTDTGPFGGVVIDPNGDLFGTASGNGDFGHGTVFEVVLPEPESVALFLSAGVASLARKRHHNRKIDTTLRGRVEPRY